MTPTFCTNIGSTIEPNIVKYQSDYQILILGIVW